MNGSTRQPAAAGRMLLLAGVLALPIVGLSGRPAATVVRHDAAARLRPASARPAHDALRPASVARPEPLAIQGYPEVVAGAPPSTADCRSWGSYPGQRNEGCYGPKQLETAYDMGALYRHGDDGKGETIAIVDAFGSPTIRKDLATFDAAYHLPAPPKFSIIAPAGAIPKWNPHNGQMTGWGVETSLDVEYAHAMAPGANIRLVETPVSEEVGTSGFPQIVEAENYVIDHHLGAVISQSFGTGEATFSQGQIAGLRSAYENADSHDVTVLAATGDTGAASPSNDAETRFFDDPVVSWPASDPLVTAVGGTSLYLNNSGRRLGPDHAWNDAAFLGASSGGKSAVFSRPSYQQTVKGETGSARGIPDLSMSADPNGGAIVYMSFPGLSKGWHVIGGTSEATPLFAGFVAVADQLAGHKLGLISPALYSIAAKGEPGIVDVQGGNNTVSVPTLPSGAVRTIHGWTASKGYDLVTGVGTIDGWDLARELAAR